jgi:hypothetical protein
MAVDTRPGTRDDFRYALEILFHAFDDLLMRQGLADIELPGLDTYVLCSPPLIP